jgi:hypothetical protein
MGELVDDNVIRRISTLTHVRLQLVNPLCQCPDALMRHLLSHIKQIYYEVNIVTH